MYVCMYVCMYYTTALSNCIDPISKHEFQFIRVSRRCNGVLYNKCSTLQESSPNLSHFGIAIDPLSNKLPVILPQFITLPYFLITVFPPFNNSCPTL